MAYRLYNYLYYFVEQLFLNSVNKCQIFIRVDYEIISNRSDLSIIKTRTFYNIIIINTINNIE